MSSSSVVSNNLQLSDSHANFSEDLPSAISVLSGESVLDDRPSLECTSSMNENEDVDFDLDGYDKDLKKQMNSHKKRRAIGRKSRKSQVIESNKRNTDLSDLLQSSNSKVKKRRNRDVLPIIYSGIEGKRNRIVQSSSTTPRYNTRSVETNKENITNTE